MKIEFQIIHLPTAEQKKYVTAYLEGILKIYVLDKLFFNQPDILLIEFAISINKWMDNLVKGVYNDLIYESMDYDEPIITLKHINEGYYKIDSIWKEQNISDLIYKDDIVDAFKRYLSVLNKDLKNKIDLELETFLDVV